MGKRPRRIVAWVVALACGCLIGCGWMKDRALVKAVEAGDADAAAAALKGGANARAKAGDGTPLVVLAARNNKPVILIDLLQKGALLDGEAGAEETPLLAAVKARNAPAVEVLLSRGADAKRAGKGGETPLLAACRPLPAGVAKETQQRADPRQEAALLLARGANNKDRAADGRTPLLLAAEAGYAGAADVLLKAGAEVDAQDNKGATALMLAAGTGRGEVVSLLLNAGANRELKDKAGQGAAEYAKSGGQQAMVEELEAVIADGAWQGATSAGGAISFLVKKQRLEGAFRIVYPSAEGAKTMSVVYDAVDERSAGSALGRAFGLQVMTSGPSYSGRRDVSRGRLELSLSDTVMVYSMGSLMGGGGGSPRLQGCELEISGRGQKGSAAAGKLSVSCSGMKGVRELTWTARRAGA